MDDAAVWAGLAGPTGGGTIAGPADGLLNAGTGSNATTAVAGWAIVAVVGEVVGDFKIFSGAVITVGLSGLRDGGAELEIGLRGVGTEAVTSGGGTAWAIPADLGSRSRVFFFAGVGVVFDFINEKPLHRYADLTAGTRE